jgi:uncharacterized protein YqeY
MTMAQNGIAAELKTAVVAAMKAKEKDRLAVLRMLQAAVKQVEVDERRDLTDDDVLKILASYARKVKDQMDGAEQSGRADLVARAEAELAIVQEFLPAALDDAELETIVRAAVAEVGATTPREMGAVMKAVLPRVAGRADGGRVSAMVKRLLGG